MIINILREIKEDIKGMKQEWSAIKMNSEKQERRELLEIKNPIKEWKISEEIPQKANKRRTLIEKKT